MLDQRIAVSIGNNAVPMTRLAGIRQFIEPRVFGRVVSRVFRMISIRRSVCVDRHTRDEKKSLAARQLPNRHLTKILPVSIPCRNVQQHRSRAGANVRPSLQCPRCNQVPRSLVRRNLVRRSPIPRCVRQSVTRCVRRCALEALNGTCFFHERVRLLRRSNVLPRRGNRKKWTQALAPCPKCSQQPTPKDPEECNSPYHTAARQPSNPCHRPDHSLSSSP